MPRHRAGGAADPSGPGTPAHGGPVLEALRGRRSRSSVGEAAPTHEELVPLVEAASRLADHGGLRPWRVIEIRGGARDRIVGADEVARRDPQIILASWCGKPFDRTVIETRPGWAAVAAVAAGQIHELAGEDVLAPGPSLMHGLRRIHEIIQASQAT